MPTSLPVLVFWDIDRTLLYVGDVDRQVYREAFAEVVGRPVERLPARGTGVTMPLAIRGLLLDNGVPDVEVLALTARMVKLLPERLADHRSDLQREGTLMAGAQVALRAVHESEGLLPSVVTGNLKPNAVLKLEALNLDRFVDLEVGGYASDDEHRPALVAVAQRRARDKHSSSFTRSNTVIIGDSLEDVRTGRQGGAAVIAVASGKTTANELKDAGAEVVLESLVDVKQVRDAIASVSSWCHRW
ncbi:HAD family hydrolase [Streptomyces sp. NPDC052236]|uniref:HAD family hydrolase n=1 Tax=Streptomyces sp. NPDC052236 TaxID=3365686 RepID=UPI0037D4E42A